MSAPSKAIVPRVTRSRRRIIFPIVDFPLPLSPISETTSPGATSKLTFTNGLELAAAERADAIGLAARVERRASAAAFQHAAA